MQHATILLVSLKYDGSCHLHMSVSNELINDIKTWLPNIVLCCMAARHPPGALQRLIIVESLCFTSKNNACETMGRFSRPPHCRNWGLDDLGS